jgi:hypothetical protein
VNQYQPNSQAIEQGDVVKDAGEILMQGNLTPQHQHKGLPPVRIDIGSRIPQPANVGAARGCHDTFLDSLQAID